MVDTIRKLMQMLALKKKQGQKQYRWQELGDLHKKQNIKSSQRLQQSIQAIKQSLEKLEKEKLEKEKLEKEKLEKEKLEKEQEIMFSLNFHILSTSSSMSEKDAIDHDPDSHNKDKRTEK